MRASKEIRHMERDMASLKTLLADTRGTVQQMQTISLAFDPQQASSWRHDALLNSFEFAASRSAPADQWLWHLPVELEGLILERGYARAVRLLERLRAFGSSFGRGEGGSSVGGAAGGGGELAGGGAAGNGNGAAAGAGEGGRGEGGEGGGGSTITLDHLGRIRRRAAKTQALLTDALAQELSMVCRRVRVSARGGGGGGGGGCCGDGGGATGRYGGGAV
jgi:hypothetical protein